jgi:hypothetical protein
VPDPPPGEGDEDEQAVIIDRTSDAIAVRAVE